MRNVSAGMRNVAAGLLMAGIITGLVSGAVGCCPCDWQEPSLEALGGRDHGFISRRGAHTYVGVAGTAGAGAADAAGFNNALFAREYSDLMSHFGQYKPILSPIVAPGGDLACSVWRRTWSASHVQQSFDCYGGALNLDFAYVEPGRVAVSVEPVEGWVGGDIVIGGCAADNGDGMLASRVSLESGSLVIEQEADLYSFWGVQARDIRRITVDVVPVPDVLPVISGLCWSVELDPSEATIVSVDIESAWGAAATFQDLVRYPAMLDSSGFKAAVADVEFDLDAWFNEAPIQMWDDQMALMSWFLLWENTAGPWGEKWTHEAVVPSKRHYFRGVWLWDAAFIAAMLAQGNADARSLGMDQVRLIIDNQAADGRFPREIWAHDVGTGFQPPGLLTWAAIELANGENDYAFLGEVYDALVANHRWFAANTDSDGDGRCEWSKEDSGMDTSPRFDGGPVEGVDLQAWMALDARLLGLVAYYIGRDDDRDAWQTESAARLEDIRLNFWDATDRMFYDRKIDDGAADPFVRVVTPVAFLPLFVQAATDEQAGAMAEHLSDPAYYEAPYGLPTVSVTSPEYESDNYWRGPVWIVTNAFAVWGLDQYGLWRESDELRASTLSMIAASPTTWEYYDSQTGAGLGSPDFMWSGVFYLLLGSGGIPMNYN